MFSEHVEPKTKMQQERKKEKNARPIKTGFYFGTPHVCSLTIRLHVNDRTMKIQQNNEEAIYRMMYEYECALQCACAHGTTPSQ